MCIKMRQPRKMQAEESIFVSVPVRITSWSRVNARVFSSHIIHCCCAGINWCFFSAVPSFERGFGKPRRRLRRSTAWPWCPALSLRGRHGSPGHWLHSRALSVSPACAPGGVRQQQLHASPRAELSEGRGRRSTPWPEAFCVSSASMNPRLHCNISPQETSRLMSELSSSQEFLLYLSPSETNRSRIFLVGYSCC